MSTMLLSDVKVGQVRKPSKWSNEQQRSIELDPFECFRENLAKNEKGLRYVDGNIPDGIAYHSNYMKYLELCWAQHLGIVVTPDILWYTLLCELASLVKSDPEQYRSLFSTSQEKQEIVIETDELVVMPLSLLIEKLKDHVPSDSGLFMPEFSTSGMRSRHAFRAAFCDMCSPYHNYSMLCCGFPSIDVRGTEADYALMADNWIKLADLIGQKQEWFAKVQTVLNNCLANLSNPEWWRSMFVLERCGSGSDVEVSGWYSDMFMEYPRVAYPSNFSTGVSIVDYKQINFDKKYRMMDGLFMSHQEGDFLVPSFGFVVFERTQAND